MGNATKLRELFERDEILVCPGVQDPLTARVIDQFDFEAMSISGYGTGAAAMGLPNIQLLSQPEMTKTAGQIQDAVSVPTIGDAENGWGSVAHVVKTVKDFIKSGVAGLHIEDTEYPYLYYKDMGKETRVVPYDDAVSIMKAAIDVRDKMDEEFVIIARTDAHKVTNGSLDEAIRRANDFYDLGADVVTLAGLREEDDIRRIGREVDAPLMMSAHYLEFEHDDPAEFEEMGYDIVTYPLLSIQATIHGVFKQTKKFAEDGPTAYNQLTTDLQNEPFGGIDKFIGRDEVQNWFDLYTD